MIAIFQNRFYPYQPIGKIITISKYITFSDGVLRLFDLSAEDGTWKSYTSLYPQEAITSKKLKAKVTSFVYYPNIGTKVWVELIE